MEAITIQGGCTRIKGQPNSWLYVYTDVQGIHKLVFYSVTVPEIGDTVLGGNLRPKEGLIINPDTSRWDKKGRKDTWGN